MDYFEKEFNNVGKSGLLLAECTNWRYFYSLRDDYVYSIAKAKGCKSSYFGNPDYFLRLVNNMPSFYKGLVQYI